jgi:glyceraldehyde 3-phosphate dehydrogenase
MTKPIRVGLMGFGRIGRNVFRQLEKEPGIEVAAISDVADRAALVYLLKFDTIFGRFPGNVALDGTDLVVDGRRIPMLDGANPGDTDWGALDIDVVVQATRKHRTLAECRKHLDAGAKRVVLASTPEDWEEMDTLVFGANDDVLGPEDTVVALGSNTSNALAPVLKVIDEKLGLDRAMFTVVHAFTNQQRLADVPGDDLRTSRAAAENIIPTSTNSPEIVERVLPGLAGKLSGIALNVPVADGSNIDLVAFVNTPTSVAEVNALMAAAASESDVIGYTDEPIVSSDVIGSPNSAVWDAQATLVMDGTLIKGIIWFDNGWGYAARVVDAIAKLAAFDREGASS